MYTIQPLHLTSSFDLEPLLSASVAEGYEFIDRLWREYENGSSRFDEPGAVLLGLYAFDQLIGVGGVHPDPYTAAETVGRVRHVYVLPIHWRTGAGTRLMRALIDHARGHYRVLTLRTLTDHGAAFYNALGFSAAPRFDHATHWLDLE